MPSQPRLRLASVTLGLALCGLPAAIAQMQPTAPSLSPAPSTSSAPAPGDGQASTSAPPIDPVFAPSAADPLGIFGPSAPAGQGAGASSSPSAPGSSRTPGAAGPGRTVAIPSPGIGAGGSTPSAFGSVNDFSAELGVRQLIDPNSPDLQPLSVSDFGLVRTRTRDNASRDGFDLGGRAAVRSNGYRDSFSRSLAGPPTASLAGAESDEVRTENRRDGARLAWPAIQSPCPDSAPSTGSGTALSCPG